MNRKVVAFDLDGTLLTCNSSFAFCRYLHQKKVLSTFKLLYCLCFYLLYKGSLISLHNMHKKVFHRLFRGKKVDMLEPFVEEFLSTLDTFIYRPIFERLQSSLNQQESVIILSASPHFLVAPLAKRWGISNAQGSDYILDSAGTLLEIEFVIDGKTKADFLKKKAADAHPFPQVTAYSDCSVDLPFLEAADTAIAVRPDRFLRKRALQKGWEIVS